MPNCDKHNVIGTTIGVVAGSGYGYYIENDSDKVLPYAIGGGLGGYLAARLADILEPSKTLGPNHRGIFHGVALNGGIAAAVYKPGNELLLALVDKAKECDKKQKPWKAFMLRGLAGLIIGVVSGHGAHLLADLTTPKGIPILS